MSEQCRLEVAAELRRLKRGWISFGCTEQLNMIDLRPS